MAAVLTTAEACGGGDGGSEVEGSGEEEEVEGEEEEEGEEVEDDEEQEGSGGAATDGSAARTLITLVGRCNAGKSSVLNALAARRVASVSRQPGHTRKAQLVALSAALSVRDTAALDLPDPTAWPLDGGGDDGDGDDGGDSGGGGGGGGDEVVAAATNTTERCGGGIGTQQACELCGLAPTGAIRSPFAAVRAAAERTQPERAYALQPNELREAAEDDGAALLSAHGLCHALAAKKGFQRGKGSSAPDAHRAGLLLVRDCAEGALLFASQPPDEAW